MKAPLAILLLSVALQHAHAQTAPGLFRVTAAASLPGPVSGRLLLFMKQGHGDKTVNADEFRPEAVWIAAQEVHDLRPGASVEFDADTLAYPHPFREAPSGSWEMQAVLDVDHSYNYGGRGPEDWESAVVPVGGTLTLDHHSAVDPRHASAAKLTGKPGVAEAFSIKSPALTRFWGRPVSVRAWVILPPGYDAKAPQPYPVAYWTHGFGGDLQYALVEGLDLRKRMDERKMPPMVWVMLDESCPQGTHEFADSVNNGPWGEALTREFLPALEGKYHAGGRAENRFVTGHSSGGWASLQLEVNYPKVFGGTWSTSPDPADFHDFTGADLYAPHANVYRKPDGAAIPLVRDKGKVIATYEQVSRVEQVLGSYGGQDASFEWVFSPKGADGAPEPMFDRVTGVVNPSVVTYWHDHYDLASLTEAHWAQNGPLLTGRIHLFVGTADTFYLDGAARLFEARLAKLGAGAHFTYIPGRTHFDLYKTGEDRNGLYDRIGAEMWAAARPGVSWK